MIHKNTNLSDVSNLSSKGLVFLIWLVFSRIFLFDATSCSSKGPQPLFSRNSKIFVE